jgi:hypothetical protein
MSTRKSQILEDFFTNKNTKEIEKHIFGKTFLQLFCKENQSLQKSAIFEPK